MGYGKGWKGDKLGGKKNGIGMEGTQRRLRGRCLVEGSSMKMETGV